jgi:hypothetical protein
MTTKTEREANTDQMADDMAWLFPEYDLATMGIQTHQGVIIERVLERGSWE